MYTIYIYTYVFYSLLNPESTLPCGRLIHTTAIGRTLGGESRWMFFLSGFVGGQKTHFPRMVWAQFVLLFHSPTDKEVDRLPFQEEHCLPQRVCARPYCGKADGRAVPEEVAPSKWWAFTCA